MSNLNKKQAQELGIAFAREVAELTGETPSRLYQWGQDLGLPVPKARQTFYSHIEMRDWKRSIEASSTESCRIGSYPISCQLRLRVVSFKTQFRQDKKKGNVRQLIVLLGYEVCSGLLHFRLYRGPDFSCDEEDMSVCSLIPAATVAAFVDVCGRMVGLPFKQVLFTQKIMDFTPETGSAAYLSLTLGRLIQRKTGDEIGDNEVLCRYCRSVPEQEPEPEPPEALPSYSILDGEHPFIAWCENTNATDLASHLSDLVKQHNKTVALPRLESARQTLEVLMRRSYDHAQARHGSSIFEMPMPPFLQRMMKLDYLLNDLTLHAVRFYKRPYEDFFDFPGDRGRLAMAGKRGDMAT